MTLTVIPVINYVTFIIFPICITSVNTGSSQNVKHFGERRTATRLSNAHIYSITCKSNKSTKKQTFVLDACYQNKISQAGE